MKYFNVYKFRTLTCLLLLAIFSACEKEVAHGSKEESSFAEKPKPLFTLIPTEKTGIDFTNTLTEGLNTNVMMYEYFYNGGGVAVGDVNGDGLEDIYFTANMTFNKLYLNKGNMQFDDISQIAGVEGRKGPWKTGVTMVDINGDSLLDIYVCYSGKLPEAKRTNQLFVNQGINAEGVPHFKEEAAKYGIASASTSTQAVFFDYDLDGDLDMFLLNHNPNSIKVYNEVLTARKLSEEDPQSGIRMFKNNNGYFEDVTKEAGISSSALTYGLGAGVSDINGDGWTDIYVCNDYVVPDYLYLNNGDGTFTNHLNSSFGHTSHFSMGNDVADIDNDGLMDIYTLDMLPEDNRRQKLLLAPDNYAKFELNINKGFHYQYMRNMLQVNNGNGTFNEVGQFSGVSNTDWSWAALFADYDNDGLKDLFVTNGYLRDYTNMDFIKYMDDFVKQKQGNIKRKDVLDLVNQMPSSNVTNYIFQNKGNLNFEDKSAEWGIKLPGNSNGAAYSDLDNDGDLDLIVNNINQPASILRNDSEQSPSNNYFQVKLNGAGMNTLGIGAKVTIYTRGQKQFLEQMPTRGYQSNVSPVLHFGLGKSTKIDSLQVVWQSGKREVIEEIKTNHLLILKEENATEGEQPTSLLLSNTAFLEEVNTPLDFQHQDTPINDFIRQPLMLSPMSFFGPCLAKGDVNGDGLEDVFVGGGTGQAAILYHQQKNGEFLKIRSSIFEEDKMSDDVDAAFFDANGDGLIDLYVCSGGYDNYSENDPLLQDRLYFNNGKGGFTKVAGALPVMTASSGCVRVADINGDGHADLFVGGRVIPGRYPEIPESHLLINNGKGFFKDMTNTLAPELQKVGMVSDAAWGDLNGDNSMDLIVVGEWMPIMVFDNHDGKLTNQTGKYFEKEYIGWWNKILVEDVNNDGKPDLLVGNHGLNTQFRATDEEPAEIIYKDFDGNGTIDPIFCYYINGKSYPYLTRDELLEQISSKRRKFPNYKSYADATITDILNKEELDGSSLSKANYLQSAYFESSASGKFKEKSLPKEVQFSPIFSILSIDYNQDGKKDLFFGGNMNNARLRFGKSDANQGLILEGDGKGNFTSVSPQDSGLNLSGDVRSSLLINNYLLIGLNNDKIRAYKIKNKPSRSLTFSR